MQAKTDKVIISFIGILLLLISFFVLESSNNFTASIVSDNPNAGNVTENNISISSSFWHGFFGEITINTSVSNPSMKVQGGEMTAFNLELPCMGKEIYLSILDNLNFALITKGNVGQVDSYLSLNSSDPQSGTQVFTYLSSFNVNGKNLLDVPTTYTLVKNSSGNITFNLGVLNHSGTLVFVSNINPDTVGFDGNTRDYQIMVPVNESGAVYHFFSDCSVAEEESVVAPPPSTGVGSAARLIGYCRDGICLTGENCSSCPLDCGQCPIIPVESLVEEKPQIENVTYGPEEVEEISLELNQVVAKIAETAEKILAETNNIKILLIIILAILLLIAAYTLLKWRKKPLRLVFVRNRVKHPRQ